MTDEKLHEAIVNFANALEAACVDLKRYIGEMHGVTLGVKHDSKDFDKLSWKKIDGSKGPYFQATKEANQDSELFQALQTVLKNHNGFCQLADFKYWNHNQNVDIIDRRQR